MIDDNNNDDETITNDQIDKLRYEARIYKKLAEKAGEKYLEGKVFDIQLTKDKYGEKNIRKLADYLTNGFKQLNGEHDSYNINFDPSIYKSINDIVNVISVALKYTVLLTQDKLLDGDPIIELSLLFKFGSDNGAKYIVQGKLCYKRKNNEPDANFIFQASDRTEELAKLQTICGLYIIFVNIAQPGGEKLPIGFQYNQDGGIETWYKYHQ